MDPRFQGDKEALKKSEQEFELMTTKEKRVAIAKDVILAIEAGVLVAKTGSFVSLKPSDRDVIPNWECDYNRSIRKSVFEIAAGQCEVCGLGALFVCSLLHRNNLMESEVVSESGDIAHTYVKRRLIQYFDHYQIVMIEKAFEQGMGFYADDGLESYDSSAFGKRFANDGERLLAIMKNIVNNNGEFRPEKDNAF